MKGNMKVWIVVAAWFWWTIVAEAALVHFSTTNATKDDYTQFMEDLRSQLASGDTRFGIPVLRDRSTVPDSQRFLLVELSNSARDSVTLAVDVTDLHVVAYQAGTQSYFFHDAPSAAFSNLFKDTHQSTFGFGGSYSDLEAVAQLDRAHITLGIPPLGNAIASLRWSSNGHDQTPLARSLIVSIELVSEAARFRYIERLVRYSISTGYQTFLPNAAMLNLENKWEDLSRAIQQSNQGVFSSPVQLQRPDSSKLEAYNAATSMIKNLAIMLLICKDLVTPNYHGDYSPCENPEPTVRIRGRNGLCVDVKDGRYNNGNPIILWTCNEPMTVNQLWTLKKDGTIRSNGKCLTSYGYKQGDYVMIYDCPIAVTAATLWKVLDNGNIVSPQSALVLSADSGDSGTTLTVETNIYASRQGWLATNNSEPFLTTIVGFKDLCMQANGDASAMWLVECDSSKAEQKWAIYADGSVRPQKNPDRCITCGNTQGTTIDILNCSPGSASQRWMFRNDGIILNLNNGMVMDVKESDPSLQKIIIWQINGQPNQKWLPLL